MENIMVDFSDIVAARRLMDQYGSKDCSFSGKNDDGESVDITILPDNIAIRTFQRNGWIAIHTLWRDGTIETIYDGKWK